MTLVGIFSQEQIDQLCESFQREGVSGEHSSFEFKKKQKGESEVEGQRTKKHMTRLVLAGRIMLEGLAKFAKGRKKKSAEAQGDIRNPLFEVEWLKMRNQLRETLLTDVPKIKSVNFPHLPIVHSNCVCDRCIPYAAVDLVAGRRDKGEARLSGEFAGLDQSWTVSDWAMSYGSYMLPLLVGKAKEGDRSKPLQSALKFGLATRSMFYTTPVTESGEQPLLPLSTPVTGSRGQEKEHDPVFKYATTLKIQDSRAVHTNAARKILESMGLGLFEGLYRYLPFLLSTYAIVKLCVFDCWVMYRLVLDAQGPWPWGIMLVGADNNEISMGVLGKMLGLWLGDKQTNDRTWPTSSRDRYFYTLLIF